MNTAYVYKWTHLPTLKWYVGSRTTKKAHPDDGYICSSKIVKTMINANPAEWKREIIDIGEPLSMYDLESEILQTTDAAADSRSFNQHNNNGKWTFTGRQHSDKTRARMASVDRSATYTEERNKKISESNTGHVPSDETRKLWSVQRRGVKQSPEHIAKRAAAMAGKKRDSYVKKTNKDVL